MNLNAMKIEAAEILTEMKNGDRSRSARRFELLRAIDEQTVRAPTPPTPARPVRRTVLGAVYVRGGI